MIDSILSSIASLARLSGPAAAAVAIALAGGAHGEGSDGALRGRPGMPLSPTPPTPGATPSGGGAQPTAESLVRIDVVGPTKAPAAGEAFEIAVVLRIEPGWHVYWENPGDSGLATRVEAALPKGYAVEPLRFPRPRTFATEYETTYGYEGSVALFLRVTPPAAGSPDVPALREVPLEIRWMVCKGVCFAGSANRTVAIPDAAPAAEVAAIVERSRGALPKSQTDRELAASVITAKGRSTLRIDGIAPASTEVSFIPKATPGVEYAAAVVERRGDRFTLTVPLEVRPGNAMGEPLRAAGLLMFGGAEGPSIDIDSPVVAP